MRTREVEWLGQRSSSVDGINAAGTVIMGAARIAHRVGRIRSLPALVENDGRGAAVIADNGVAAGWAGDGQEPQAVVWRGC